MRENCFGLLYDEKSVDCTECILVKECEKFFRLTGGKKIEEMTDEELMNLRTCFGCLYSEKDAFCGVCLVANRCKELTLQRIAKKKANIEEIKKGGKKIEEDKKGVKKTEEDKKEVNKVEEVKKEKVTTQGDTTQGDTTQGDTTQGDTIEREKCSSTRIVMVGDIEIDLNSPGVKVSPTYQKRYLNGENPFVNKNAWWGKRWEKKGGNPFGGQSYVFYEWIKSKGTFTIAEALQQFPAKNIASVIKLLHFIGAIEYKDEKKEFVYLKPMK